MNQLALVHYGKLGMKWGRRTGSSKITPKKELKTVKPSVKSLSDQDLKNAVARLQLEKQYKQLSAKEISTGKKIVNELLVVPAKQAIATQAAIFIGKALAKALLADMMWNRK